MSHQTSTYDFVSQKFQSFYIVANTCYNSLQFKAWLKNMAVEGSKIADLPIPIGKYKMALKAYIEDRGKMRKLADANIYIECYEAY